MNKILVAVYGSLRRGMGNSSLMSSYNTDGKDGYVGKDKINGYSMRSEGYFPAIMPCKDTDINPIVIEVYEVNQPTFEALDGLEGYPSFYNRELVNTSFGEAWIYFQDYGQDPRECGEDFVESGDWVEYHRKDYN